MTIKDVARQLNLSTATVSRAFTPGSRIHPKTRARILEEAQNLGYAPNPSARNLVQKRSRLIGIDFPGNPDVLSDLYLVELARGVQMAAQSADYGLLLNTLPRPGGDIDLLREWVFGRAVDGVVIVVPPEFPIAALASFAGRDVPCVLIMQDRPNLEAPFPTVTLDLTAGARAVMTHLQRLGHTRIGFITSNSEDGVAQSYQCLPQMDDASASELVIVTQPTIADGRAAMHRMLAAQTPPTAVFCRTDILALGAIRAARDMGLRVPEDVSIVGHDNIALAEIADPPLTTISVDTSRVGQLATKLLLEALSRAEEGSAPQSLPTVSIETEIVVRGSTARNIRATT